MQDAKQIYNTWDKLTLFAKLGNIGSEVERTIKWKEKGNEQIWKNAFMRSLDLFDLTLTSDLTATQLKEVARARELWVDFAYFNNQYNSTAQQWKTYFNQFAIAYRNQQNKTSISGQSKL